MNYSGNFAWSHTGNGCGRDVLLMLYPIPIHNYIVVCCVCVLSGTSIPIHNYRILIAVKEVLTLLLFYFEVSSCLLFVSSDETSILYTCTSVLQ